MKTDLPGEDSGSDQEALDRLRRDSRGVSEPRVGPVRSFLQDQAERLQAASLLEKGVLLGGLALAVAGLALVVGSVFGGSSSDGADVLLAADSITIEEVAATNTATQMPVSTLQPGPPTVSVITSTLPTAVANRESCQEIRGTAYLSVSERSWYVANCGETEVSLQSQPVAAPTSEPPVLPLASPTSEPPRPPLILVEPDSFSADAIASAASWISTQAEAGYEVDRASCTASDLGYAWLVSCRVHVSGCESATCDAWLSACVTEPDGAILPTKLC